MSNRPRSMLAGLLLVAGCASADTTGVADLDQVLVRANDTPGKQGYLYVAMVDAEVAAQYAGRARAAGDDLGAIRSALGEVVYALDPDRAPAWEFKSAGLVSGWAGRGYGVRRATERAAAALGGATAAASASPSLRQVAPLAERCLDNTSQRAARLLTLTEQALSATSATDLPGLLLTIETLALELNDGAADASGASSATAPAGTATCGLRQATRDLRTVVPAQQSI